MSFWDWKSGHRFQALDTTAQPGSLDAEAGLMSSTFDRSGLRLICGEADKTSKYHPWRQYLHPLTCEQLKYGNKTRTPPRRHILSSGRRHSDDANFKIAWETESNNDTTCLNGVFIFLLLCKFYIPMPSARSSGSSRSAIFTSSSAIASRNLLLLSARWASKLMRPAATRSSAAVWT